jgi:hypothetical protein
MQVDCPRVGHFSQAAGGGPRILRRDRKRSSDGAKTPGDGWLRPRGDVPQGAFWRRLARGGGAAARSRGLEDCGGSHADASTRRRATGCVLATLRTGGVARLREVAVCRSAAGHVPKGAFSRRLTPGGMPRLREVAVCRSAAVTYRCVHAATCHRVRFGDAWRRGMPRPREVAVCRSAAGHIPKGAFSRRLAPGGGATARSRGLQECGGSHATG